MADLTGIENAGEFFSAHYLQERLPEEIKGYGHVKLANFEKALKKRDALLAMLRDPKPGSTLKAAE